MERRVAVRGIVVRDGKLLCFKLKPYQAAITEDFWCTPGGTVDPGEALQPALEREMLEETGIKPTIGSLLYIQQFIDGGKEHLEFFFHITNGADYLQIDLAATTHGTTEIAKYGFIDPTQNTVLPKFLTAESFDPIDANRPTKVFNNI